LDSQFHRAEQGAAGRPEQLWQHLSAQLRVLLEVICEGLLARIVISSVPEGVSHASVLSFNLRPNDEVSTKESFAVSTVTLTITGDVPRIEPNPQTESNGINWYTADVSSTAERSEDHFTAYASRTHPSLKLSLG
jgi:hypothetical protein